MKFSINWLPLVVLTVWAEVSSCQKEVFLPLPEHQPRLVIHGYLEPDSVVTVLVGRSYGANEAVKYEDLVVKDATVSLYQDGVLLETLPYLPIEVPFYRNWVNDTTIFKLGRYESSVRLTAEPHTYEIRVSHPDYGMASGVASIYQKPVLSGVTLRQNFITLTDRFDPSFSFTLSLLQVAVNDNPAENNAYTFDLEGAFYSPGTRDTVQWYRKESRISPAVITPQGYDFANDAFVLDTAWNGQTYLQNFLFDTWGFDRFQIDSVDWDTLRVGITTIPPEEVRYRRAMSLQQNSSDIDFFPTEPVVVRGNVTGGYGCIFTKSRAEYVFVR